MSYQLTNTETLELISILMEFFQDSLYTKYHTTSIILEYFHYNIFEIEEYVLTNAEVQSLCFFIKKVFCKDLYSIIFEYTNTIPFTNEYILINVKKDEIIISNNIFFSDWCIISYIWNEPTMKLCIYDIKINIRSIYNLFLHDSFINYWNIRIEKHNNILCISEKSRIISFDLNTLNRHQCLLHHSDSTIYTNFATALFWNELLNKVPSNTVVTKHMNNISGRTLSNSFSDMNFYLCTVNGAFKINIMPIIITNVRKSYQLNLNYNNKTNKKLYFAYYYNGNLYLLSENEYNVFYLHVYNVYHNKYVRSVVIKEKPIFYLINYDMFIFVYDKKIICYKLCYI